jgi:MFS family permease
LPASFALVGETLAASRHSMGIGVQSVIKRLPIMIAPFLGGVLIDHFGIITGVRLGLAISVILSTATLFLQSLLPRSAGRPPVQPERWNFWRSLVSFTPPLRQLLISDILIRFCERIPFAWVVIYAMDYVGADAKQVGLLVTIEMVTASLCIIPASHFADKYGREPFVFVTFIMFALFPLVLWFSHSFALLVIAFLVRGLKEFGDTSRKALIVGFSDRQRRGQIIGAYYLARDLPVSLGAFLGAALWKISPTTNLFSAAVLGIMGIIFYLVTLDRSAHT